MGFIILLLLSTLSIAGSAAFFSVYGLARVFSGAFLPTVIMASSLEAGKLVSASFLYRYWNKITKVMRNCLISFVAILMLITSMGIFGFLSNAYQDNVLPYEQHNQQITLLESEKAEAEHLKAERLTRQEEINKQIANLPNNFVNGRRRLIDANKAELEQINKDIAQYTADIRDHTTQISKLKGQTIQETAHVGPIIFMAKAFGMDVNQATKWLIILIIFVFDPLAVTLTIALNMVILDRKKKKEETKMLTHITNTDPTAKIDDTSKPTAYIDDLAEPTAKVGDTTEEPTAKVTFSGDPFGTFKIKPFEPSDPPVYSDDKQFIKSKDGMLWSRVAPHAAAAPGPVGDWGRGIAVAGGQWHPQNSHIWTNPNMTGAAPAPSMDIKTITVSSAPIVESPNLVKKAFDVFTRTDLSPHEQRMKEELEALLKRHQEVLDANLTRAKS